jgi:hypothetical protein
MTEEHVRKMGLTKRHTKARSQYDQKEREEGGRKREQEKGRRFEGERGEWTHTDLERWPSGRRKLVCDLSKRVTSRDRERDSNEARP